VDRTVPDACPYGTVPWAHFVARGADMGSNRRRLAQQRPGHTSMRDSMVSARRVRLGWPRRRDLVTEVFRCSSAASGIIASYPLDVRLSLACRDGRRNTIRCGATSGFSQVFWCVGIPCDCGLLLENSSGRRHKHLFFRPNPGHFRCQVPEGLCIGPNTAWRNIPWFVRA